MVHPSASQPPKEAALSLDGVAFAYPNVPYVLNEITLTIEPGERVGMIGPNGAGKTTLFLTICGVLRPSSGEVSILGKPVIPGQFRPEVGLVFQNPNDQLFSPSVWDDVAFGVENLGYSDAEVAHQVHETLDQLGILDYRDRPPHHLSGGQKRMVAIAGVLAMKPDVILYDEPSANLDLRSRRRLIEFLQQSPQTLLVASHDLELILELCDRVLLLDKGQLIADGPPAEILGDRTLMECHGLETPSALIQPI
ncbi:MAG: ABC transporter ATP-binding protein [Sodalinema sp.]|uniref:energy-coupling factor ABC transporter ATP-binding protein n=1 Tax=Sodalinema sp. TaxID=3080550 RepID=UPI00396F2F10